MAYFFDIELAIPGTPIRFPTSVGFTPAIQAGAFGLLGQNGFFDRFKITFDQAGRTFTLDVP